MNADQEYFRLLDLILTKGKRKKNRTGTDTIGVFGAQARFDLNPFPLLTTKKMAIKSITHELLWFIKGDTNIKYLVDNGCNIWNDDCYRRYLEQFKAKNVKIADMNSDGTPYEKSMFVHQIKTFGADSDFVKRHGDLGQGTYGQMWREFPFWQGEHSGWAGVGTNPHIKWTGKDYEFGVDQLSKVIEKLKTNPDDRRLIVSAWHAYWSEKAALAPCHVMYQFHTEELTVDERISLAGNKINAYTPDNSMQFNNKEQEDSAYHNYCDLANIPRRRLSCQMYQRSCDFPLGIPFNWASYAILTQMVAQSVNMVAGELIWTGGDCHIYVNQIDGIKEQMTRQPMLSPTLWLNPEVKSLFDFKIDDVKVLNYESHPAINFPLSTG